MSRSLILVILLVGAGIAPLLIFNQSEDQRGNHFIPPPATNPSAEYSPQAILPQDATFSQASFGRVVSPADLPATPDQRLNYPAIGGDGQAPAVLQSPRGMQPTGGLPADVQVPFGQRVAPGISHLVVPPFSSGDLPPGTETYVFPGNQFGPNLNAGPMAFQPVSDLRQIFRFDISPEWVKQRWDRVSTTTVGLDFRSLRVALVTGVNPWDIHGSLTYYFDSQQKLQRISFRGWTGDGSHFLKVLTEQFPFEAKPTNWAGVHSAKKSGLFRSREFAGILMKEPAVIQQENRTERLAIVMELNNPDGSLSLSKDYLNLESQAVR